MSLMSVWVLLTWAFRKRCSSVILALRSSVLIFLTSNFSASTGSEGWAENGEAVNVCLCSCQFEIANCESQIENVGSGPRLPSRQRNRCRLSRTSYLRHRRRRRPLHRRRLRTCCGRVWKSSLWKRSENDDSVCVCVCSTIFAQFFILWIQIAWIPQS